MHHVKFFRPFILGLVVLAILIPSMLSRAQGNNGEEIPFDVVNIFFELNNTDGDLGIHALIDGEPWRKIIMKDPNDRRMLVIRNRGRLAEQGLTELFFESAEPQFEELAPEEFFNRFPEGIYEVEGLSLEGEELGGEAEITHFMPAPAENLLISGLVAAVDCDSVLPVPSLPLIISWDPVTNSHPDLGITNSPITVVGYQVVLDREEPTSLKLTFDLPPGTPTVVEIPPGLFSSGDEVKLEVLVRESSGNQTATETCFVVQ